MQNNLGKTLTYNDLVNDCFDMGGIEDGENGIFNIGEMINGGVNFNVIYNALLRIGVDKSISSNIENCGQPDREPYFNYSGMASMAMINNSQSENLKYNMATSNILSTAPETILSGATPILTPVFCSDSATASRWEHNGDIYYFLPQITSMKKCWIGLGVKSTCWSHDNPSENRWIIGKRLTINRDYNYIFKVSKDKVTPEGDDLSPNFADYVWTQYTYRGDGAFTSSSVINMDNRINDTALGYNVSIDSVYNRLSGNYYDILGGLNYYWDISNENRNCTCLFAPTRGTNGTSGTVNFNNANLHAAPHKYLGDSTSSGFGCWSGSDRPFNKYRHIVHLDLNYMDYYLGQTFHNLILYPGMIDALAPGQTGAKLIQGSVYDLYNIFGNTVNTINSYNQYIRTTSVPTTYTGGRIMYIIPPFGSNLVNELNVYINVSALEGSTYTSWQCPVSGNPDVYLLKLGTLMPNYAHIIECWVLGLGSIGMKMYRYDENGQCVYISDTTAMS